jgi:RNA-binding protein YhbY
MEQVRLANPELRRLKAAAQRLEPVVRVGKPSSELGEGGLTEAVL